MKINTVYKVVDNKANIYIVNIRGRVPVKDPVGRDWCHSFNAIFLRLYQKQSLKSLWFVSNDHYKQSLAIINFVFNDWIFCGL